MKTIGDLIARDLDRKIEEIIKVDQTDEDSVYTEITEYVATDRIRDHYRGLLREIAEAPQEPHEGVGVWISGFFGSGKSSFAKNLGYLLANRTVRGRKAADLLKAQLADKRCSELIDSIVARIPTEIVMFDVQTDKASGGAGTLSISHYMYRSLLRTLGYAEDFDIADLEQSLEADARLEEFIRLVGVRYGDWEKRRKGAAKMNEASAVLHEMDPKTFPAADSWAKGLAGKTIEVTPGFLVEKTFELAAKRRAGKALVFVIDEVGAYVARSAEKIEDLRAVVEQFGKTSKNRVKARKAPAPVWIVVTSQEKLDDVVAAIDSKRVELAKLQDRFKYRIDLGPADIREVATKRVLAKKDAARPVLAKLFTENEWPLNERLRLEAPGRKDDISRDDFVDFYPYPPHFIELSIDVMSGIRLQPGAARHLGGSNRTIIKQAFEMLASERTALAHAEVGRLVTLDLVYDLVEGNLSSEKQKDLSDIAARFGQGSWEVRVAKALTLLEFVRGLPRTEANLAALLYDRVGADSALPQVKKSLEGLVAAQFVRNTEEGFKLQTASEKNWMTERRSIDPRPRDRAEVVRETVGGVFAETKLESFRYHDLATFKVGLTVDGAKQRDGDIPLSIMVAEDASDRDARAKDAQTASRQKERENEVLWVFALTPEIDDLVAELFRSRQMVTKYDQLRGQGRLSPEEASCLATEKNEVIRLQERLRDRVGAAIEGGTGFFRGVSKDGSALGRGRADIFRGLFEWVAPDLYPKLGMGSRKLGGKEAEEVLKAANLSGLPQVLYGGDEGLGLVREEGGRWIANPEAPIAREILDFVRARTAYGERVTGRLLEDRFTGMGYRWDRDMVLLVLAVLLRAGAIEVTHQGRRFRSHQDPLSRAPFTNTPAFRAASFAPRESIALKTLTTAAEYYEAMTGQEVDVEESAIAQSFRKLAEGERSDLAPLIERAAVHHPAVVELLREYKTTLDGVLQSSSDDCVRILASEGRSFKEVRERVRKIREGLSERGIAILRRARQAAEELWPVVEDRSPPSELDGVADELRGLLEDERFHERLDRIAELAVRIADAYGATYTKLHVDRDAAYALAIDAIKGRDEWVGIRPEDQATLLGPLQLRLCGRIDRDDSTLTCRACGATVPQMESDLSAVTTLRSDALARLQALSVPEKRVARVRIADFHSGPLRSEEDVKRFVEELMLHLIKLIDEDAQVIVE